MRLFAAVLPPAEVLGHLDGALEAVRRAAEPSGAGEAVRWTPPEARHLTVAFYGDVPEGYLTDVADELAGIAARRAPFDLALRGAGTFDRRTLWIGCAGDAAALARLTREAVAVGRDLLGRSDDRVRSRAHLTVARVGGRALTRPDRWSTTRRGAGGNGGAGENDSAGGHDVADDPAGVASLARALAVYRGPTWRVDELVLVSSELGAGPSGHARHEIVRRFALAAVAG